MTEQEGTNQNGRVCTAEDRIYARWAEMVDYVYLWVACDRFAFNVIQEWVKKEPRLRAALHARALSVFPGRRWNEHWLRYKRARAEAESPGKEDDPREQDYRRLLCVEFAKDHFDQQVLELNCEPGVPDYLEPSDYRLADQIGPYELPDESA